MKSTKLLFVKFVACFDYGIKKSKRESKEASTKRHLNLPQRRKLETEERWRQLSVRNKTVKNEEEFSWNL